MKSLTRRAVLAAAVLVPAVAGAAEPPPGSPLRKAVLDAMRVRTEQDLGPPIQYLIKGMNVEGNIAFVAAEPQRMNGQKIDWRRFPFYQTMEAGGMSDEVAALLRFEGGAWRVEEYAFGFTDVVWIDWPTKHRFPERLISDAFR